MTDNEELEHEYNKKWREQHGFRFWNKEEKLRFRKEQQEFIRTHPPKPKRKKPKP